LLPTTGRDAFGASTRAHVAFDRVREVGAIGRTRDDLISEHHLVEIEGLLDTPEMTLCRDLRNKFVAHAADTVSRRSTNLESFGITLDQITAAQRSLVIANHRIRLEALFDGSGSPVPTPQFDQFKLFDYVFVPHDRIRDLHEWWYSHTEDREKWCG
jgi:hypothetical protein